jgi:hypothetical protein
MADIIQSCSSPIRNLPEYAPRQRAAEHRRCLAFRIDLARNALRLPLIPPAELSAEQKALYDDMRKGIATNVNGCNAPVPERE